MSQTEKNLVCALILFLAIGIAKNGLPVVTIELTPTAEKLWIVALDDARTRTPAQTNTLRNGTYWDTVRARGHHFEAFEKPSPGAARFAPFSKFADELVFQDAQSGKVLGVEEISAAVTTADVDRLIAKFTGAP